MQSILREPLFRRTVVATCGAGTLLSFLGSLALGASLWTVALTAIGAAISLALGFLLGVSALAYRAIGPRQFWTVSLQNYLVLNAINAALVFFMTADPALQFKLGLIGLAFMSPLIVGASWFTQATTPKPAA